LILHNTETSDHFDDRLHEFLAVHAAEEECYELTQHMRTAHKPKDIMISAFWYRLVELNEHVWWLPGAEPQLTQGKLRQAFHDAMRNYWKRDYAKSGRSLAHQTDAQILHYFGKEERQEERQAYEQLAKDRKCRAYANHHKGESQKDGQDLQPKYSGKFKFDKHQKGKGQSGNFKIDHAKRAVTDSDRCPVHPHRTHTWGECYSNARNARNKNGEQFKRNSVLALRSLTLMPRPCRSPLGLGQVVKWEWRRWFSRWTRTRKSP
jgi:hypothetical protein